MSEKDDDERLWNLVVFKIYATDEEMGDLAPFLGKFLLLVLVLAIIGYAIYKYLHPEVIL